MHFWFVKIKTVFISLTIGPLNLDWSAEKTIKVQSNMY